MLLFNSCAVPNLDTIRNKHCQKGYRAQQNDTKSLWLEHAKYRKQAHYNNHISGTGTILHKCTLLQCNVYTSEPASVVEQLVKGQRSHPTLKPHNHSLPHTVCMVLTLFLCKKSALKFSHSSRTRSLRPWKAASRTAVLPSWERGAK